MVTDNPDPANRYATRIINLLDGKVTGDSNPCDGDEKQPEVKPWEKRRQRDLDVPFFTALNLSLDNLMTKRAHAAHLVRRQHRDHRHKADAFALSTGVQHYLRRGATRHALPSYPITIEDEQADINSIMAAFSARSGKAAPARPSRCTVADAIYSDASMYEASTRCLIPK